MAIMLSINAAITMVAVLPLVLVVLATNMLSSKLKHYRRLTRAATSKVAGFIGELFGGVQAVKVAAAERPTIAHFSVLNDERRRVALIDSLLTRLIESFNYNTANMATGLILLLAADGIARHVQRGHLRPVRYLCGRRCLRAAVDRSPIGALQADYGIHRPDAGDGRRLPRNTLVAHEKLYLHGELPRCHTIPRPSTTCSTPWMYPG